MTGHTRRLGRLFYCLISALLLLALPLRAADPAKTVVADTIYRADGTTAKGTLLIAWPAFSTADGKPVAAGTMSVKIGANGAVNIPLIPTQGATPSGTAYKVVIALDDGSSSTEYWAVPTLSPATIAAIRATQVPATIAMQVVSRDYVDGQLATAVRKNGDESIGGTKTFESSPAVPSPSTEAAAVNKAYVDTAIAAAAPSPSNVLNINKGGTGTSGFTPAKCVRVSDDGNSLESASGDCGGAGSGGNADTVDGMHASQLTNATSVAGVAVTTPTEAASLLQFTGSGLGWQAKGLVDARDYQGATPAAQIDSACAAAGPGGAVMVPSTMGPGTPAALNCKILDFRASTPMFYADNTPHTGGLTMQKNLSDASGYNDAIRARIDVTGGGTFNTSEQTAYMLFNADGRMRGAGQLVGYWGFLPCYGIGNCMGTNLVIEGWGGTGGSTTGHAQTQITGLGEINMTRGSFQGRSTFKATVSGSPAPHATTIGYTAETNEDAIGMRRIYNVSRKMVGDGTAAKVTGVSGDVMSFSGTNFTSADVGRFIAVGTTAALYAPTGGNCNGNDVVIDGACTPDFDQIIAVLSPTQVQLEGSYDTIGLTTAWPQPFLVVDGSEVRSWNMATHTATILANNYSWQNGDTLISPPESHGEFLGANILMTPVYKRRGVGAPVAGYYIGSQGSAAAPLDSAFSAGGWLRYGLDFAHASFVNPSRALNFPANTGLAWGADGGSNFLASSGNETYVANNNGDANFCQYITPYDATNYTKTCLFSGTTYGALTMVKGGTGTAKPLYVINQTNGTVTMQSDKWFFDSSGNLYPADGGGNLGLATNKPNMVYAKVAVDTPKIEGITNTSAVTNLNADMLDGKHAAAFALKIASGTATLGTASIAANSCASAVTVAATGVVTTDVIRWTPNADITAVTGYTPGGTLKIYPYPTADNVNFKVCNADASNTVTPGAVTLNWEVTR